MKPQLIALCFCFIYSFNIAQTTKKETIHKVKSLLTNNLSWNSSDNVEIYEIDECFIKVRYEAYDEGFTTRGYDTLIFPTKIKQIGIAGSFDYDEKVIKYKFVGQTKFSFTNMSIVWINEEKKEEYAEIEKQIKKLSTFCIN